MVQLTTDDDDWDCKIMGKRLMRQIIFFVQQIPYRRIEWGQIITNDRPGPHDDDDHNNNDNMTLTATKQIHLQTPLFPHPPNTPQSTWQLLTVPETLQDSLKTAWHPFNGHCIQNKHIHKADDYHQCYHYHHRDNVHHGDGHYQHVHYDGYIRMMMIIMV